MQHAYIHNLPLQTFLLGLRPSLSQHLYCVMLILYMSNRTYNLKATSYDRFFEKLLMTILFTFKVFARNLLTGSSQRKFFLYFVYLAQTDFEPCVIK